MACQQCHDIPWHTWLLGGVKQLSHTCVFSMMRDHIKFFRWGTQDQATPRLEGTKLEGRVSGWVFQLGRLGLGPYLCLQPWAMAHGPARLRLMPSHGCAQLSVRCRWYF